MIYSEVQRTLVKSPPELWAELSDPAALARHLGELGDIRIVRTEPERTVEWAAENTTGTVSIKPSGWGTKVTLSVTREVAESEAAPEAEMAPAPEADLRPRPRRRPAPEAVTAPPPEAEAAPPPEAEVAPPPEAEVAPPPEAVTAPPPEAAPELRSEPEAADEPKPGSEPETAVAPDPQSETEPRRGFFARLFGRRRREPPSAPASQTVAVGPADPSPRRRLPTRPSRLTRLPPERGARARDARGRTPVCRCSRDQGTWPNADRGCARAGRDRPRAEWDRARDDCERARGEHRSENTDGIAAELMAAAETRSEEVTAVLTAVLDRLGAAHHRPFSRS